jgi:4-diphosphocytidyl-2-C-methyl-D-erythritol kinase
MMRRARLKAYAKINLGLRILYRRSDGYHELRTAFQTIGLADDLEIEYRSARATSVTIDGAPHIPDNLVERAARALLEEWGTHADVRFRLRKKIPAGAGLGGGSTDAAAVLLSLPVLAGKKIAWEKLHAVAASLGSDIPFFLEGGLALGLGRGEELYPLPDLPSVPALIVAPFVHSSTADAYRDLSPRLTAIPVENKLVSFRQEMWGGLGAVAANDFESVVFARHPELERMKSALIKAGATAAAMTGSGSSLFGLFGDTGARAKARRKIESQFPGACQVFETTLLNRSRYRAAWRKALAAHLAPASRNFPKGDLWPPRSRYAR